MSTTTASKSGIFYGVLCGRKPPADLKIGLAGWECGLYGKSASRNRMANICKQDYRDAIVMTFEISVADLVARSKHLPPKTFVGERPSKELREEIARDIIARKKRR